MAFATGNGYTGILTPRAPATGYGGLFTPRAPTVPQAQTPAQSSAPQIGPSSLTQLRSAGLLGNIGHPNADAIQQIHAKTLSALNNPPAASSNTGKKQGDPLLNIPGTTTPIQGTPPVATGASTGAGSSAPGTVPITFPGLIGSIAGAANAVQTNPLITQAEEQYMQNAEQLPHLLATITNEPGLAAGDSARGANLLNAYGQGQQGLAAGINAALAPTTTQLGGLESAAGLVTPSGNFPFVFNPATGQFTVSGGDLTSAISTGVQQAISNPTLFSSLNDAITSTFGAASAGMFQRAYIAAGGNPAVAAGTATGAQAVAAAKGQTEAANIQTAGTAATGAASTAYRTAVQHVSNVTGLYTAATGVANNLTNTLGSWSQNGQLTNLNAGINTIAALTSSPDYSKFIAALTNTQAAYTAAFQTAGITPTQSTQNALQELNPNSSASAIVASLNQLSSDLHAATIVPAYQQQSTYAHQLGIQ